MGCGCGGSTTPAPPVSGTAKRTLQDLAGSDYWNGPAPQQPKQDDPKKQ